MTHRKEKSHGRADAPESAPSKGAPQLAGSGTAEESPPVHELQAELDRVRAREDELLRAVAELTNVNRRRRQEMETIAVVAQENLIRNILPVLDDIDRALDASKNRADDPVRQGVVLIRERLWKTLEKEGVEEICAMGVKFDPELFEAVAQRPSAGHPADTVLDVVLPGYRFKGRVLRHAQVVVAGPQGAAASEPRGSEGGTEEEEVEP